MDIILDSRIIKIGTFIRIENIPGIYYVAGYDDNYNGDGEKVILDRPLELDLNENELAEISDDLKIFEVDFAYNGIVEVGNKDTDIETNSLGEEYIVTNHAVEDKLDYIKVVNPNTVILNSSDFEMKYDSIAFVNPASKLKFIAKTPGTHCNDIEICVATPESFRVNNLSDENFKERYAFEGITIDSLFEYAPKGDEIGIVIKDSTGDMETYLVSTDPSAKNHNNKSIFIENVINNSSKYVYVKLNNNDEEIGDYTLQYDRLDNKYFGKTLKLLYARDSEMTKASLLDAYNLFENVEEIDVDIIIANELDGGNSVRNLVDIRKDCIGFIGARYEDTVGYKASQITQLLLDWRQKGDLNFNNMFLAVGANYKYQYDRYNDKNRWVNIAGDLAGLRAQTNANKASWWASAGLDRGQIKNAIKLAFSPDTGKRDLLYKAGLNPICSFPGQGNAVVWGQKTLLDKPSSFDRINVRGLFNTLERSLSKMARYSIMEFNDSFTRNNIVSMINPFLAGVQSGRGIQDYMVICDESNNTPDVISRNQLVVDIYIKPNYVSEFILLRFTNAGTRSFAEVIGA